MKPKKPKTGGRTVGTPNKKTLLKLSDFFMSKDIDVAAEIWANVQLITDPAEKAKMLLQLYKYIEAPPLPVAPAAEPEIPQESCDILQLVKEE